MDIFDVESISFSDLDEMNARQCLHFQLSNAIAVFFLLLPSRVTDATCMAATSFCDVVVVVSFFSLKFRHLVDMKTFFA